MKQFLPTILLAVTIIGCLNNSTQDKPGNTQLPPATNNINYSVTQEYPHDTALFTEGLLIHEGKLFESTGSPEDLPQTRSLIGITDLKTGKFEKKIELDKTKYFGEGIVFLKNKLYQLTYKKQVGFIYDADSFKKLGQFSYTNSEGWSLTTDGTNLIMSDGTDQLTYLSPENMKPIRYIKVKNGGVPQDSLNELEFIKGFIYANIWLNNAVVKIDPADGKVVGKMDLSSLTYEAKNKNPGADVLNGIAYDSISDKIYVTGKKWANIYEIKFAH